MARRRPKPRSRFCLTPAERVDFDAAVFAALYESWARWERRARRARRAGRRIPEPPCHAPGSFRKHLPARCTDVGQNSREATDALRRLRGRGLVKVAPDTRGRGGAAYCLVPKRSRSTGN